MIPKYDEEPLYPSFPLYAQAPLPNYCQNTHLISKMEGFLEQLVMPL